MSRIRSIKPEWTEDELIVLAEDSVRVLSVALICLADDYGNGRAGRTVASRVWPNHPERFEPALAELERIKYVKVYEVDGQRYFAIRNWQKHQKVDHPGKPLVPPPPGSKYPKTNERPDSSKSPTIKKKKVKSSQSPRESLGKSRESLAPRVRARTGPGRLDSTPGPGPGPRGAGGKIPATDFEPTGALLDLGTELGLDDESLGKSLDEYRDKTEYQQTFEKHCSNFEKFLRSKAALIKKSSEKSPSTSTEAGVPAPLFFYRLYKSEGKHEAAEKERLTCERLGINWQEN